MTNLLPVNHRCTMHKSWLCQTCLEDHSQVSCNLITIEKELKNRKSVQLDKVKLFQDGFEEAYKDAEDCKHQYKRQIEENIEEITNYEAMVKRLQEKIKRKRIIQVQLEFRYATCDKKLERLKDKKSPYDKAITSLMTSETIKSVSRCLVDVQFRDTTYLDRVINSQNPTGMENYNMICNNVFYNNFFLFSFL